MSIANGNYRIQSVSTSNSNDTLELKTTGQVIGAAFDPTSDNQKWKVTKRGDGSYDIASVGTGALLAVASPSGSETAYTLSVSGDKTVSWTFDTVSGTKTVITVATSGPLQGQAVDLSDQDRTILWDRNNFANQIWILEPLNVTPPKVAPTWVAVTGTSFPTGAIQGGWDASGNILYVARGYFTEDSTYRSGKAGVQVPGVCRIPFNANERVFSTFDVLVADKSSYEWVPFSPGKIDVNGVWAENQQRLRPIVVGNTSSWGPIFIIRCMSSDNLLIGHAAKTSAWVGLNGNTVGVSTANADVLCYTN